jgi:hypothetical protein
MRRIVFQRDRAHSIALTEAANGSGGELGNTVIRVSLCDLLERREGGAIYRELLRVAVDEGTRVRSPSGILSYQLLGVDPPPEPLVAWNRRIVGSLRHGLLRG